MFGVRMPFIYAIEGGLVLFTLGLVLLTQ